MFFSESSLAFFVKICEIFVWFILACFFSIFFSILVDSFYSFLPCKTHGIDNLCKSRNKCTWIISYILKYMLFLFKCTSNCHWQIRIIICYVNMHPDSLTSLGVLYTFGYSLKIDDNRIECVGKSRRDFQDFQNFLNVGLLWRFRMGECATS